ncbi:phage tail protein [Limimaricola sp. AA108-03]|uniref:phage tail protein n=1 Tax=Limimaricola sp. AA108-03 TaxID=3425945 RepID=UPI003D77CCEF
MLHFDFNGSDLKRIADEFGASEKQLEFAYSRALRRTASRMRTMARKGLRERLDLRSATELRKRLHGFRFKKGNQLGEVRMWFGLNDLRASAFKGRPRRTASGAEMAGREVTGGFVGRNRKGRRTVMRRTGPTRHPIAEARLGILDEAETFVEDEVFSELERVFMQNFRHEIRARTIYEVGK